MGKQMDRKHLISIILVVLVGIVALFVLMGGFGSSTPSLGNFSTAEEIGDDDRPVEEVTEFSPDTEIIYATCELSNAPPDTEIKTEWYYLDDNERFTTLRHTVGGGSGPLWFRYELENESMWPVGDYEVRFFLNGERVGESEFSVEPDEEASLSNFALAENVDDEGRPVETVKELSSDTEKFYVTFEVSNALSSTEIRGDLYYVDNESLVLSTPLNLDGFYTGPAKFHFTKPHDGWPTGNYEVRVFLDGDRVETISFSVKREQIRYKEEFEPIELPASDYAKMIPSAADSLQARSGRFVDAKERYYYPIDLDIENEKIDFYAWGGGVIIYDGSFEASNVGKELEDRGFEKGEYKGVETWSGPIDLQKGDSFEPSDNWVAFVYGKIVNGDEQSVKACIETVNEERNSLYDGDKAKTLIDGLEYGDQIRIYLSPISQFGEIAVANSAGIMNVNADKLYFQGLYLFSDSDSAESSFDNAKQRYEEQSDYYQDFQISRDNNIIQIFIEGLVSS